MNSLHRDPPDYPHLRLTAGERFPRLFATRRPEAHEGRLFGPYLPDTAVRRLLDLLQRTMRLRTCTIDVDGSWAAPCTEYTDGRCLAPCVAALCDAERYSEAVEDAILLLSGDLGEVLARYDERMRAASETTDFESAARLRDERDALATASRDLKLRMSLDAATDIVVTMETEDWSAAQIMTLDKGKVVGRRLVRLSPRASLVARLAESYGSYFPQTVYLPEGTADGDALADVLSRRAARRVSVIANPTARRPTMVRLAETEAGVLLINALGDARARRPVSALEELTAVAGSDRLVRHIECFDAAHLHGDAMTASVSVFRDGELQRDEYVTWSLATRVELEAIAEAIAERYQLTADRPDLVVVDGGASQLAAAVAALKALGAAATPVLAVTKPRGRPKGVAYVLPSTKGERIELEAESEALRLLKLLRDEAHWAANFAHRHNREVLHYARGTLRPAAVVVPTRIDEPGGDAADLRPITVVDRAGRVRVSKKVDRSGREWRRS